MNALRLVPLVVMLAACTTVNLPLAPHRIDVQQGNALDQDAVDKLKVGMSRSQVRFLLGTPLLVDPFHSNRWDYVYNYRTSGKLTERKRLTLLFDGEVLARIQAEGLAASEIAVSPKPAQAGGQASGPPAAVEKPAAAPAQAVARLPAQEPLPAGSPPPSPVAVQGIARADERSLAETSIVPPLDSSAKPTAVKAMAVSERPPEPVMLQTEANVEAVKPDLMPPPSGATPPAADGAETPVLSALNAWAQAWKARDEDAYIAAYARSFRPQGGLSRAEWEKRRRLLLGVSHNIDVRVDAPTVALQGDARALVRFNQFYSSDRYQDAVVKQLTFVRTEGRWLIEEEKVLGPVRVRK
jgi:outer membrane protein assembly factor BamE